MIFHTWIDPVIPVLAMLLSFVGMHQLKWSSNELALKSNRYLLRRFVEPQVVDQLLKLPEEQLCPGGVRQKIVILFADVRGFTSFAEIHSPEEVIDITNRYMEALTLCLPYYDGILDKYTGDGLMALFHTESSQAVECALMMQEKVAEVSQNLHQVKKAILEIGISLHVGEAVLGLVGSSNRFNYTALGHTVVVAARLNSFAGKGEVVISGAMAAEIRGLFEVKKQDTVLLRGISKPTDYFLVKHRISEVEKM